MNTKKIKEIIKFNIEKDIQNKWFVIFNVFVFIGILISTNWTNISKLLKDQNIDIMNDEEITIQIIDKENIFYDDFITEYCDTENLKTEKLDENPYSAENIPDDNIILVDVTKDDEKIISAQVISKEAIDGSLYDLIYDGLANTRSKVFAEKNGINLEELNILNEDVNIERKMLGIDAENSDTKQKIKLVSVVIVYMVLIFVLSRIANEIAQEKVSKSIEYVLTSVSEKEYLLAKVSSATLTILIQILYTFVYYAIANMISNLFTINSSDSLNTFSMGTVDVTIVGYVIAMCSYLVFTVFLTTLIQAALSSKTTNVAEAGNTTALLLFLIIALYFISISVISPYSKVTTFMYIISCIPIVSTFFVPSMIIIGQATTLQIVISFILLIFSVPLIFNLCSKYFKNGILDYTPNKKKKALSAKKELNLKEKQDYDLRKKNCNRFSFMIGMAMILTVFLEAILSLVFNIILQSFFGNKLSTSTLLIIENSLILIIALGLTSLYIKSYSKDFYQPKKKLDFKEKLEIVFIGISFLTIIQIILSILYQKIGLDHNIFEAVNIKPENTLLSKVLFITGIAIVPAVFEELLFRKAILNVSKKFGNTFAVLFSAILFALYHMNLNQAIFALLIGILFGIISIKTGSIKLTMLLHFLNNGFACMATILDTNSSQFNTLMIIVIILAVIGGIIILKNIPKLRNLRKEELKISKDCKFLLQNYTFIISMALMILLLCSTENMLRLMN